MTHNNERDELAQLIERAGQLGPCTVEDLRLKDAEYYADAILAAGYVKPRQVTTPDEANELPDRSAILTPGDIIFRKWKDYYGDGKHAWERELGQMVPAELLSAEGHFPATVLHVGSL